MHVKAASALWAYAGADTETPKMRHTTQEMTSIIFQNP